MMIVHASRLHYKRELHIVFWFDFNADFTRFTAALLASNAHCILNCTFDADYTRFVALCEASIFYRMCTPP